MIGNILSGLISVTSTAPVVTGGTLYTSGGYNYRLFTSNGTLTVSNSTLIAEVLCIAGGGAGSSNLGGGGGAGGLLYSSSEALTPTSFAITIGAGGTGGTAASPMLELMVLIHL